MYECVSSSPAAIGRLLNIADIEVAGASQAKHIDTLEALRPGDLPCEHRRDKVAILKIRLS